MKRPSHLPTPEELTAYRLRLRLGLTDGQIADLLGIARETANRRIARAAQKVEKIRQTVPAEWEQFRAALRR